MPFIQETFIKVRDKHSHQLKDLILPIAPTDDDKKICHSVVRQELRKYLTRFNPGSSGSRDCLLPQHLKDLTEESLRMISNDLLDAFCRLLNEIFLPGSNVEFETLFKQHFVYSIRTKEFQVLWQSSPK